MVFETIRCRSKSGHPYQEQRGNKLTKKEAKNLIGNAMAYKYETSKHVPWYDRKLLLAIYYVAVFVIACLIVKAFISNKPTNKELLLQQREQIYSEIYE